MAKDLNNETVKIKSAQRCQARNGSNYFKLTIQDKEGETHNTMLWECHNEHEIGINNEINISCNYDPNYKNYTINCFALVKKGRLGLTEDERQAKENGLVVVFGTSDDIMEFRGAIDDDFGCYGGKTAYFTKKGLLESECDDDCTYFYEKQEKATQITAVWEKGEYAWQYSSVDLEGKFETFDIYEDGEKYCKGIVFSINDVK